MQAGSLTTTRLYCLGKMTSQQRTLRTVDVAITRSWDQLLTEPHLRASCPQVVQSKPTSGHKEAKSTVSTKASMDDCHSDLTCKAETLLSLELTSLELISLTHTTH